MFNTTQQFEATILLEQPPDIEVVDGLFYLTDRVGGLVIRRCFRPSTFLKAVRKFQKIAVEFTERDANKVTRLTPDESARLSGS